MKESYGEGVASHTDPESCAVGREASGEALTGAHTDQPLSSEISSSRVPTLSDCVEGNIGHGVTRVKDIPNAVPTMANLTEDRHALGKGRVK